MTIEKIDTASDKTDVFNELSIRIANYIMSSDKTLKERLLVERKLQQFKDKNGADWVLNLILNILAKCHKKENS